MFHIAWMGRSPRRKRRDANRTDEGVGRMQRSFRGNTRLDLRERKCRMNLSFHIIEGAFIFESMIDFVDCCTSVNVLKPKHHRSKFIRLSFSSALTAPREKLIYAVQKKLTTCRKGILMCIGMLN